MSSTKRAFEPMGLELDEDARIDAYAAQQGIPDLRKAAPVAAPVAPSRAAVAASADSQEPAPRAELRTYNFELPAYALQALKQKALDEGVSVRHIVMRGLVKEGIEIAAQDLVEDGRRRPRSA